MVAWKKMRRQSNARGEEEETILLREWEQQYDKDESKVEFEKKKKRE